MTLINSKQSRQNLIQAALKIKTTQASPTQKQLNTKVRALLGHVERVNTELTSTAWPILQQVIDEAEK